jgi:hypothetical protein
MSAADDPRRPAVQVAVTFWNKVFLDIGSPFRLGQVTHLDEAIPYHYVRPYPERSSDELDWLLNVSGELAGRATRSVEGDRRQL